MSYNFVADVIMLDINVFYFNIKDWLICLCYRPLVIIFKSIDNDFQPIFLPIHNDFFQLNALHISVFLEDLNQNVLLLGLQKIELCKQKF